jgi:hypothetical protein
VGIPEQLELSSSQDNIFQSFLDQNISDSFFPLNPNADSEDQLVSPNSRSPAPLVSQSPDTSLPNSPLGIHSPMVESHPTPSQSPQTLNLPPLPPRRSTRTRKLSVRLDDYILQVSEDDFDVCIAEVHTDTISDDITLDQALADPL